MARYIIRLTAIALATLLPVPLFAQSTPQAPARAQSVPASRFGTALGLPRDGAKPYLPDEAYPRFPIDGTVGTPPGGVNLGQLRAGT